jgi:radical SAM-linked protein
VPVKADDKAGDHDSGQAKRRFRLFFSKTGPARYLSHLELIKLLIRALRRTGLDIVFSEGYHPMPKLSFACALPVGTESISETADIELYGMISTEVLKEKLNFQLPDGINILGVQDITGNAKNVAIKESHYHIDMSGLEVSQKGLDSFIKIDYFGVVKKTKKGEKEVDAKKVVKNIRFDSERNIELEITHSEGPALKPAHIIAEIFKVGTDDLDKIKVLKVKQITG